MRRKRDRRWAGVLSVLVIAAAAGVIVKSSFSAGQYYRTVAETSEDAASLIGESFRIAGRVLPGSIVVAPTTEPDYTFRVHDAQGATVTVHYAAAVPDTFKDGSEVVVEGRLAAADRFEATHLVAKCPSKYEGALTPEEVARREAEAGGAHPADIPRGPTSGGGPGPGAAY